MDLIAIEEIKRLKYRYFRTLDLKLWDEFGDCLAEDVVARYGTQAMDKPLHYDNRADVVEFMSGNLGEGIVTIHIANHPEIDVDGDTATGRWYLQDKVIVPAFQFMLEGAAFYEDRYARTPDGWRVAHTGYRRTFEITYDLKDLPGTKVNGPGEHTHV